MLDVYLHKPNYLYMKKILGQLVSGTVIVVYNSNRSNKLQMAAVLLPNQTWKFYKELKDARVTGAKRVFQTSGRAGLYGNPQV